MAPRRKRAAVPSLQTVEQKRAWLKAHPRFAFTRGVLWHLLDANQLKAYWRIRKALKTPFARFVLNWARRTGKTFVLLLIATEESIRNKGHRYNVAAATKESLREFVWPALERIFETCPEKLRPRIQEQRGRVTFPRSKSYIVLAGCNDARSVERLRGPHSHGNIVEEMGAIPDSPGLKYILVGVLNPQLMTTGGWTLCATTPPRSAGHQAARMCLLAEANGNYSHCTLYQNPRLEPATIEQYLASDASLLGMTVEEYKASADYRREWLAIIETDPAFAVLPAFTTERKAKLVCGRAASELFVDRYDSMDIGFSPHFTGLLYAEWSFARQRLRIVGERLMRRMGTPELAGAVRSDEVRLWGRPEKGKQVPEVKAHEAGELTHPPFLRVADNNNPILLNDLAVIYGLLFTETAKDNLRAAVADVNRWIGDGTLEVDPSCKMLIAQMTAATWNNKGTEFDESEEFGHFDLIASLVYLVRNVIPNINRLPPHYGKSPDTHFLRPVPPSDEEAALRAAFGVH